MTDVHNPATRSKNMRAIRNKDTGPEIRFRKALYAHGLRYRLHVKTLPGTPDLVLAKFKTVIFVNGCFWHGHRCHLCKVPKTRTEFWLAKISDNISRDVRVYRKLTDTGWRVAVIWECAIKGQSAANFDALVAEFVDWLGDADSVGFEST
jgi:DNA mismatch endonuclease (patch repair protein)